MFRSEDVVRCQLFIQPEASYTTVAILGEAGIAQFTDMNSHTTRFHRKFVGEVRRCDEVERKLRYVEAEVQRDGLGLLEQHGSVPAPQPREIIQIESFLEKTESELVELSRNAINLKSTLVELTEMKHVVESASVFWTEGPLRVLQQEESESSLALLGGEDPAQLGFVAGVVARDRVAAFERMLWRISRGNVFLRLADLTTPLEDPTTGERVHKTAFVAFFQGDNLKTGVQKVCAGFRATTYPCPGSAAERAEVVRTLRVRLADITLILNQTQLHRERVLVTVRRELLGWAVKVRKMKAIYHTLNMFDMDVTNKCFIGECWVPVSGLPALQQALHDGGKEVGGAIPSFLNVIQAPAESAPPTFIRSNKFTAGFQALVNAYAVPSYKEVNPGLYTMVTFPFLFAVMFGDLGHGIILTLFALYMVLNESKFEEKGGGGEIWRIMFGGRYIILMMGFFSMYTGLIYNDVFSVSLNIFQSSWKPNYNSSTLMDNNFLELDPATTAYSQLPYPFGVDPIWQMAQNKIVFLNSFKMKLSIIIGVLHMIFGLSLSCINHIYNRKWFTIVFEFIPQLLFLVLLFGYLAILMFAKWVMFGPTSDPARRHQSPSCAPSVLITFINMMLLSEERGAPGCNRWMYPGQGSVQRALLLAALTCIPCMLLARPLQVACRARRRAGSLAVQITSIDDEGSQLDLEQQQEPNADTSGLEDLVEDPAEEPLGEVMVHQAIHTIEYVLSTVSHTASYLRLWALSLAHAQLSEVLWRMALRKAFAIHLFKSKGIAQREGAAFLFIIFPAWACLTVAILVLMEGLSAFLHTLRLHWVEFMSKFYQGAGQAFQPFSFDSLFKSEDAD